MHPHEPIGRALMLIPTALVLRSAKVNFSMDRLPAKLSERTVSKGSVEAAAAAAPRAGGLFVTVRC